MRICLPIDIEFHLFILLIDLVVFSAFEKSFASQKNVENNSRRKDIALGLNMLIFIQLDDLRGYVTRSPASVEQVFVNV